MKKLITILLLTLNLIVYSQEEIYVALTSRGLSNTFFPLLKDGENTYISIDELWSFYDLINLQIIEGKRVVGKIGKLRVDNSIVFPDNLIVDGTLYINLDNLGKIIPMNTVDFDEDMYTLYLEPNFKLPYEVKKELLSKRRALKSSADVEEEKDVFIADRDFIGLGLLELDYHRSDLSVGDNESVSFGYASQLLYGELNLSGSVYDEREMNYVNLNYEEVGFLGGKNLSIGDVYLNTYSDLDVETSMRGFTITGNEFYGRRKQGEVVLQGMAHDVETIEVYQNNILVDYQNIEDDTYRFDIKTSSSDDEFKLIKYYKNGREEEEIIYLLGDSQIFPKGSWDYIVQTGRSKENDKNQYMYNVKYGFTNNLTLGLGNSFFKSEDDDEIEIDYNIIEGNLAYRTGAWKYPSMIIADYLWDTDNDEGTLFLSYTQRIRDYKFLVDYEKYSNRFALDRGLDESYEVTFGRRVGKINVDLGYLREEYDGDKYQEVSVDTSFYFKYFRVNIDNIYEILEDTDNRHTIQAGIDYTGRLFNWFNLSLNSDFYIQDGESEESYSLRLSRRGDTEGKHYIDFEAELTYDSYNHLVASLDINYYFDDFMRLELPVSVTEDDTTVGLNMNKVIALGDIRKQYIKDKNTFWVDGVVFVDSNANGNYDDNETPLEGVGIRNGDSISYTDEFGRYSLQSITANETEEIELIRETLDPTLEPQNGEMFIKGRIGKGMFYSIPLLPLSSVGGNLLIDTKPDALKEANLYNKTIIDFIQNGEVKHSIVPEYDGFFIIDRILPGKYDVEITYLGNGFEIKKEEFTLLIPSSSDGDYYEIEYKINVLKKENDDE